MARLAIFIALSGPVIWVSRRSLPYPRSHGFPRFFAFEAVLALLVLNVPYWFREPFRGAQLTSWVFLCVSGLFVVWGFVLLRRLGGFRPSAELTPEHGWEETGRLVTAGVYRYIRHPMYSSVFFLAWGALLKRVTIGTLALGAVATLSLIVTAKSEEAENLKRFGTEYLEYMKRTHRFVPFLF
jgi:protein-S-isoprenylcysteine O-methyltransferase Ste14